MAIFKDINKTFFDEQFYAYVINTLKKAQKRGAHTEMSIEQYLNHLEQRFNKYTIID